jgi:hypothetical protein
MLYTTTIRRELLDLAQRLFSHEETKHFVLVGGTCLALQIGHRKSVDIDLFTTEKYDVDKLVQFLQDNGFPFAQQNRFKHSLMGFINNVKVDFIHHPYEWISEPYMDSKFRLASLQDIAAMKLNAIVGSGTRYKDFADVAFLSGYMSLGEMIDCYEKKYPNVNGVMVLKSLCYFDDINFEVDIEFTNPDIKWEVIEKRLLSMVKKAGQVFEKLR